mgnify:CR=1 FL=1|tara:strand:+ start:296 stop:955 length:660 start_codon:yes stop_codon:yes gene_type:complete
MSRFGWAYVNTDGGPSGPEGSVQFLKDYKSTSGSANFMYHTGTAGGYAVGTLVLDGTLVVEGTVSASHYHIANVTEVDAAGSSKMGDTTDDLHQRTGSFVVVNQIGAKALEADVNSGQVFVNALKATYRNDSSTGTTATSTDDFIIGFSGAGSLAVSLHSAIQAGAGSVVIAKDQQVAARTITLNAYGSETIDGSSTYLLNGTFPAINLYSDGSNWFVF